MHKPTSVAVMSKEVRRVAKMRQREQYDEKVRQVRKILNDAGYNCGQGLHSRKMDIEFFLGRGSVAVIALCNDKAIYNIDILIPLSLSSGTDDTLDALRKAVAA